MAAIPALASVTPLGIPAGDMSMAERLAALPRDERNALLDSMAPAVLEALAYDWGFWGRPDQQLPDDADWLILALLGGRGSGKTRTGAEAVRDLAAANPGRWGGLIAPTPKDARDIMIEGESGILAVSPPDFMPVWEPSKNRLTWPNGARAAVYSAADPEAIRGPNLAWAWCDEMGKWKFMQRSWDNLRFSLRAGDMPRTVITTTPVGHPLIRRILAGEWTGTHVRRVSTYRNAANLAPSFLAELLRIYEGTRLGLQELHGMVLDEIEGALWTMALIQHWQPDEHTAKVWVPDPDRPGVGDWLPSFIDADGRWSIPMRRVVVGVDPSGSKSGAEAGVVVCAVGMDGHGYVLEDLSGRMSPKEWGTAAVDAYRRWGADRIVAEVNFGAEMVRLVVESIDANVSFKEVHASRGKQQRAEPVVGLYEQQRVTHVGRMPELETELTQWVPPGTISREGVDIGSSWSPGRLDAMVWALTELMLDGAPGAATLSTPKGRAVPIARQGTTDRSGLRGAPGGGGRIPGVRGVTDSGLLIAA